MKILVTGAGGFIGSHLTEKLVKDGHEVSAFFQYSSTSNRGWLENSEINGNYQPVFGNVSDFDSISSALVGQELVFHLAALIGIPYSYTSPKAYIRTNIEGTYNILEAVRRYEIERLLITSTSEVYGSAQYVPIDELHPLVGQSPYSASKIGADQLAISYYRSFGTPVNIVRPFNTYGPRQSLRAVIPTIICQALMGGEIKLGNIDSVRDFNYVDDTVNGFLEIAKLPQKFYGESINIASGTAATVGKVVDIVQKLSGIQLNTVFDADRIRPALSEVDVLLGCNKKIMDNTAWVSGTTFEDGVEKSFKWFKDNLSQYKNIDRYSV